MLNRQLSQVVSICVLSLFVKAFLLDKIKIYTILGARHQVFEGWGLPASGVKITDRVPCFEGAITRALRRILLEVVRSQENVAIIGNLYISLINSSFLQRAKRLCLQA